MRIAHLADLHLGYRAYNRTAGGINVRERDVAAAFSFAVDKLLEIKPDAVVIAGDIFHGSRPSNTVLTFAMQEFTRLSTLGVPIVVISGNHDQPNTVETGDPVAILRNIINVIYLPWNGCETYQDGVQYVGYPFEASNNFPYMPAEGWLRVAVVHGPAPTPDWCAKFDLVFMGHWHITNCHHGNAFYAGSLERCSTNIWIEESDKGFYVHEIGHAKQLDISSEYIHVPTRPVLNLLPILRANCLTPEQLSDQIAARLAAAGDITGKIVRQVIEDCPNSLLRAIRHEIVREARSTALHYQIAARRPIPSVTRAPGEAAKVRTLEQEVEDFILNGWTPSDAGIDKKKVLELARYYLGESQTEASQEQESGLSVL